MRATEFLTAHHDELRALMRELAQTPASSTDERRRLVNRLMAELSMHEQIEDEIFYPASTVLSALVPIAHAEHRQLEAQLAVVLRTGPSDPRFDEELAALIAAVEHHAGKEESAMFLRWWRSSTTPHSAGSVSSWPHGCSSCAHRH